MSEGNALGPLEVEAPEVLDFVRESCTAQAIRLCRDYGRLLGKNGASMLQAAQSTAGQCSAMAGNFGSEGAGLSCATRGLTQDAFVIVTGKGAVDRAQRLFRRFPDQLVAPAAGPIRADLPAIIPGIFIIRGGGDTAGPFTEGEAVEALQKNSKN